MTEDASGVISKVYYGNETNRFLGSVLPCDNKDVHVPFSEGFIVGISFKSIEGL